MCIQSAINSFGSAGTGGSIAALTYEYFAFFMTSAFSTTATTFVSQNFGAKKFDRCKTALRYSFISGFMACELLAMLFVFGRDFWINLISDAPEITAYAASRMTHVLLFECLTCTYEITGSAMRGLGHSLTPALLTIFGTCIFRIFWVFTICKQHHDFDLLMTAYPISWVITGTLVVVAYFISSRKTFKEHAVPLD